MGLMSRRRALLQFPSEMGNGWYITQITVETEFSLGDGLANLLSENLPNVQMAIGVLNCDYSQSLPNNTAYWFCWNGTGIQSRFSRYRNGSYEASIQMMTNTYACVASQGSVFTVAYLPTP